MCKLLFFLVFFTLLDFLSAVAIEITVNMFVFCVETSLWFIEEIKVRLSS